MIRNLVAGICFILSLSVAAKDKPNHFTLHPLSAFDFTNKTPVFLAGDALVMNANEKMSVSFTYGTIKLVNNSMLMISKVDDRIRIQNLNQAVTVTFKNGSDLVIWPYFEMSLKRDMNHPQGFVIEQFQPLDLKTYLIRYQKVVKPDPQTLIGYGRSLKKQIEKAKIQFAESARESSQRKVASVADEDVEKQRNERKTKQLRKSLRQKYEEKTLGQTLAPST